MILEVGKNNIRDIRRKVRKSNDYGTFENTEVRVAYITEFASIDISSNNREATIVINSNIMYWVYYNSDAKQNIDSLLKVEVRDSKINSVIA